MESGALIAVIILVLALGIFGVFMYLYFARAASGNVRSLMSETTRSSSGFGTRGGTAPGERPEFTKQDFLKIRSEQNKKKKQVQTLEQKFFMAGIFTEMEKRDFHRLRIIIPCIVAPLFGYGMYALMGASWVIVGVIMGVLIGMQVPVSILDRKIIARGDEIMYFLPLVIEQLAIGVSSSLDIGPCIQKVVSMADERDSHNVVTELIKIAQNHVRAGASLEQALTDVGILSGHTELKHTFMSLSQVARHGGEITRQLQELADAVSAQRETKIDAKIKKLELAATGPVAVVFCGFLIILLIGFGIQIMQAFE